MKILLVSRIDNPDALAFTARIGMVLEKEGSEEEYDRDTANPWELPSVPWMKQTRRLS